MIIHSNIVDVRNRAIYFGKIHIEGTRIVSIEKTEEQPDSEGFIIPGFVDAHIHIESSMLPPAEFARLAVVHGTVATVSDPHEIANVLGVEGVNYMLKEASKVPFKFCFGAPSCVPATSFETAGASLNASAVEKLLSNPEIGYLSEMMNFPGVIHGEEEVINKIRIAQKLKKPIDGHAPGLRGAAAKKYFEAGISTDHECFTYEEALEKVKLGVKILIREGSAARNFNALWPLINEFPEQIMFCSDDKHPDELIKGHINQLVQQAVANGCDLFDVLMAACIHPVEHYSLKVGTLKAGDPADFIRIKDLTNFDVLATWLDGKCVAENGKSLIPHQAPKIANHFKANLKHKDQFKLAAKTGKDKVRVIEVIDGEIVTKSEQSQIAIKEGCLVPDLKNDILKIVVINRYQSDSVPSIGFVKGFGLTQGALASSVAHDSHNIVAVGTDDESICAAVNLIIEAKGGISAVSSKEDVHKVLLLPIAGLMSDQDGYTLAEEYAVIDNWTKKELACKLTAPFMTLSFLALPVIPTLKITDLGLFDVDAFGFVSVEVED